MRAAVALATIGAAVAIHLSAQAPQESSDKYQWLEDVHSERSLAWVNTENQRSNVLVNDPRFAGLEAVALAALESPDRLAYPAINGADIYNTWQDAAHVRGILRRTSIADYLMVQPHWQTVLDYDALAKQDNERWVQKGSICLYPGNELCLIALSAGGEDAISLREFNLKTGKFVEGGFVLPRSKQNVAWLNKDTLLVSRDWGPGAMTRSGYPFVVKELKRGELLERATEIYRGADSDELGSRAAVLHDGDGHQAAVVMRGPTFFETELSLLKGARTERIALPGKVRINGLVGGQVIVTLNEDWKPEGQNTTLGMGSIVALNLDTLEKDPLHLKPNVVFAPSAKEFAQSVAITKDRLLLTTLENVQGRAYTCVVRANGSWARTKLAIPDDRTVSIVSTNWSDNQFFLELTGFLNPPSLWIGDAMAGTVKAVKTLPAKFDASQMIVKQLEAVSKDGTRVPYFVVRRADMKLDGSNPTVLTAYGGFQNSETPYYMDVMGKLWLERGGVFVLANIRGGGEFGPAWHEAGLKTHRQRIYDDFAAVGQDLVKRGITSPRRLGIVGGSNGGLLVGVEMTQHPEMWNAVAIQVPLLDMLRFEQIAAGASWVGEYGSVKNPEERAFLASISPYQQLKRDVNYPEPLIFTTTKDDRVGPAHARKFAAKMEEFGKPFFYDELIEGGHAAGADLKESARTAALEFMYFTRKLLD
jgi:prolyl oligopeptidase